MVPILVSVNSKTCLATVQRLITQASGLTPLKQNAWVTQARREAKCLRALYAEGNRRLAQPINELQRESIKQLQSELLWAERRLRQTCLGVSLDNAPAVGAEPTTKPAALPW